jgi:hypothetical protein
MNDSSPWHPGQRVRCLHDRFPAEHADWGNALPRAGQVYTVRAVHVVPHAINGQPGPALLLEELVNPAGAAGELHFSTWRFEPVTASETKSNTAIQPVFKERSNARIFIPIHNAAHEPVHANYQ